MKSQTDHVIQQLAMIQGTTVEELTPVVPVKEAYAMLLLDTSSSMRGVNINQAKSGAKGFAELSIEEGVHVGLVEFNSTARVVIDLTTDASTILSAIEPLQAQGTTDLAGAIQIAYDKLKNRTGERVICIVTDGVPNDAQPALDIAIEAKTVGIQIKTIGVDNADLCLLRRLSSEPEQAKIVPRLMLASSITALARWTPNPEEDNGLELLD